MSAYVYDSSAHDWTRYQGFQRTLGYTTYHQQGVHYNGSLYFATCEPFLVVGFNLSTGSWDPSEADLPDELTFVMLVSGNGNRLFMFGGIGTFGISTSMKVWELDPNGRNWNEIKSVPELMYRKIGLFCPSPYMLCLAHQLSHDMSLLAELTASLEMLYFVVHLQLLQEQNMPLVLEELGIGCLNALIYPTNGVVVSSGFRLYPSSMVTFNCLIDSLERTCSSLGAFHQWGMARIPQRKYEEIRTWTNWTFVDAYILRVTLIILETPMLYKREDEAITLTLMRLDATRLTIDEAI
ncbi:F-box/kelch-repeat protein [Tanacetum coccineum]